MTAPEQSADVEPPEVLTRWPASRIWNDTLAKMYAESPDPLQHGYGAVWKLCSERGDDPTVQYSWDYVRVAMEAALAALGARLLPAGGETVVEWRATCRACESEHWVSCGNEATARSIATRLQSVRPGRIESRTVTTWSDGSIRRVEGEWGVVGDE